MCGYVMIFGNLIFIDTSFVHQQWTVESSRSFLQWDFPHHWLKHEFFWQITNNYGLQLQQASRDELAQPCFHLFPIQNNKLSLLPSWQRRRVAPVDRRDLPSLQSSWGAETPVMTVMVASPHWVPHMAHSIRCVFLFDVSWQAGGTMGNHPCFIDEDTEDTEAHRGSVISLASPVSDRAVDCDPPPRAPDSRAPPLTRTGFCVFCLSMMLLQPWDLAHSNPGSSTAKGRSLCIYFIPPSLRVW